MLSRLSIIPFLVGVVFCCFTTEAIAQSSRETELINAYNSASEKKDKFNKLMSLGEYYRNNNIHKADSLRSIILDRSIVFDDSIRTNALFYSAEVSLLNGDQETFNSNILACQSFLSKLSSEDFKFKLYLNLGRYHTSLLELETADFYFKSARKAALSNRDHDKICDANRFLALNFMFSNQKDSALYFVEQAINSARRTGDNRVLAEAFNTQAEIYRFFGQIELSVAKNLVALRMVELLNDALLIAQYSREIGGAQSKILNFEGAESYFRQSFAFAQRIDDRRQMALALSELAKVQLNKGEFNTAIQNADRALKLLTKLHDKNSLGITHSVLGLIYEEQKKYELAANNFNQALVYFETTNNKEQIAEVYHNVGTIFQKQKKYKNALTYLNRSIEIREQFGAVSQVYKTYRVMADVYRETNNSVKALEYLQLYLNFIDSNTTVQAATKIAELSESYLSEQKERIINSQKDSIERQRQEKMLTSTQLENSQLRNTFQMYIILAFLIIVLLAGISVFYRWNQTKIRQQQREAEMSQTLLRTQMNPHFVFNAMSVIQSYIFENDTVNSSKFLVNFSRLMRLILENSPKEFIPISTEIEILEKYLAMQKLRFQDRFEYQINTDELLIEEEAIIPPMITQPFIENAIEHGQLHLKDGGFIHISFSKENNMLVIKIEDNGIGRKKSKMNKKSSAHKSMAMSITRQRIDNLNYKYKSDGKMLIEDYDKIEESGTKVLISLPYNVDLSQ